MVFGNEGQMQRRQRISWAFTHGERSARRLMYCILYRGYNTKKRSRQKSHSFAEQSKAERITQAFHKRQSAPFKAEWETTIKRITRTLKMKKLSGLFKKYWLLFFFVIMFLFMAVFKISPHDLLTALSSLTISEILILITLYFLISLAFILQRKYLLKVLNFRTSFKNLVLIHFSSMAAHYSTPAKIGFPLSVYLLKKLENIPYPIGTSVIILELTVSTGLCGLLALLGALQFFTNQVYMLAVSLTACILISLILFFLVRWYFYKFGVKNRITDFIYKIYEALTKISFPKMLLYFFMTLLIQILSSLTLALLAGFMGAEVSLWQAIIVNTTAFFIGSISMVPMGLGVREASIFFYLRSMGVADGLIIPIAAIQRMLSTGLSFLLGMVFGAVLGIKTINDNKF